MYGIFMLYPFVSECFHFSNMWQHHDVIIYSHVVCVRACVCACVRACMRACVRVCVRAFVRPCACVRAWI